MATKTKTRQEQWWEGRRTGGGEKCLYTRKNLWINFEVPLYTSRASAAWLGRFGDLWINEDFDGCRKRPRFSVEPRGCGCETLYTSLSINLVSRLLTGVSHRSTIAAFEYEQMPYIITTPHWWYASAQNTMSNVKEMTVDVHNNSGVL